MTLSSKLFGRKNWLSSPATLIAMILAGLLPLVITYFFMVQANYWINWNIPLTSQTMSIVSEFFGFYAVGAYCLIVLAVLAFSFKPFKFDSMLFGIRFAARIIQLLFVIDVIILVPTSLLWVSFILIIPVALSYFILMGGEFRVRFRIRDETMLREIPREAEEATLPIDAAFELSVAGAGISDFKVKIEQSGGSAQNRPLYKSSVENQYEVGVIPVDYDQDLPCTILILHKEDHIRRIRIIGEPVIWLRRIRVELVVNSDVVLREGEVNFVMSDAKALIKLVEKVYDKYNEYFTSGDLSSSYVYIFLDENNLSPRLNLKKSLRRNGIKNNQKIRIEL